MKALGWGWSALIATISGAVQALALTYPLSGHLTAMLQIVALAVFVTVLRQSKSSFVMSWLFATTWLVGSVAWLYISLHVFGHLPAVLSVAAIFLLCGGLAIYYAATLWVYARFEKQTPKWFGVLLLAASWTLAEMARAQWFTGFPWAAIGYAHVNSVLSYAAPYVGVYGVGFASVVLAGVVAYVWNTEKKTNQVIAVCLILLLILPAERKEEQQMDKLSVSLLQGNIAQDLKYGESRDEALRWYKEELMKSKAEVTVLPETAVPYFKHDLPEEYWTEIEQKFQGSKQAAIIGIPTRNADEGYGNSAITFGMHTGPLQYDKHHLVPFGEFIPQSFKWFNKWVDFGLTDFKRGGESPQPFGWQSSSLSVNICYEDLFGEELAKRFVSKEVEPPDVMVNISNLGWFGDTYVVDQHLNIARMRSLEFNRPTVRATNSGGTAIINAQGRVEKLLMPYTRGVLNGEVNAHAVGITPYALWAGHWGLKPLWVFCLFIWGCGLWLSRRTAYEGVQSVK